MIIRKINLLILSLIFFSSCGEYKKQPLNVENSEYPIAPKKNFLRSANLAGSQIDDEFNDAQIQLRTQYCNFQDPKEQAELSAILGVNGSLLGPPTDVKDGYTYAYENILGSTKNLIDNYDCFYPELYLAHANILLRVSEIPTELLNSENGLMIEKINDQKQNKFANQESADLVLKFSKFAKLNSVIRESQTALNILLEDSQAGLPFQHISMKAPTDCSKIPDPTAKQTYLFGSQFDQCNSASGDKYAEAEVFANYLLAKTHYERAIYRLQGIISAEDLNEIVPVPNDLNFLGDKNFSDGNSTVRSIIANDLQSSIQSARSVYSSGFCSLEDLKNKLPPHMSTMCGDLENIFGNDLSITKKTLEQMPLNNDFVLQIGRLICTTDSSYTIPAYAQKFCLQFLTQFPNTKNSDLKLNGMSYTDINSWALNLAGVAGHLVFLENSLVTIGTNINTNKDTILKTEDINKKIDELNAQAISIGGNNGAGGEILISQNNIQSKQSNVFAQGSAVSSAQSAILTLQNQKLNAKNEQVNLFRDYLGTILKKQYTETLLKSVSLSDATASVIAFKKAYDDNASDAKNMLLKEKNNVQNQWVSQCVNSVLIYNNNIDNLETYKCEAAIKPTDFWSDKNNWSTISSDDYKNKVKDISNQIQSQISAGCNGVAALAAVVRAGQMYLQNDAPSTADGSAFTSTNFMNYASALATLSSEQQTALNAVAQIEAEQAQFNVLYHLDLTSDKKFPLVNQTIERVQDACLSLAGSSPELTGLEQQILENNIVDASQKASVDISVNNLEQEKSALNQNIIDFNEKINNDAQLLTLNSVIRNQYENESISIIKISLSDVAFNAEVQKFSDGFSDDSPSMKALDSQLEGAKAEEQRAESLLTGAKADLEGAQNNWISLTDNYAQIQKEITNYNNTKNSFVFSSLVPSSTSYADKLYLISEAQESAQSLLKVLAFRTMSFETGVLSNQKYTQFLIFLDSAQQQCRYFASFDDARKCITNLRDILDPSKSNIDFGLYGSDTTKTILQIYSDDFYSSHDDLDERTPDEIVFNNKFIQNLRDNGNAILPLNTATLASTLQGASKADVLKSYALKRVVGVSVNIIKNQKNKVKDLSFSQEDNRLGLLRDGLNNSSGQGNDCDDISALAQLQAQQTKQMLIDHKFTDQQFSIQLQNLMSPSVMTKIICQKVNWVEKSNLNPDSADNINDLNTANTNWILKLKPLTKHNIVDFFQTTDGAWNKVPGLYNPQLDNMSGGSYSNIMSGCIYDAIHSQTVTNLSSFHCSASPIQSDIDFKNIAGRPLMGNWNFVYGEYGVDAYEYNLETQKGGYADSDKTKLTGLEITFYLSKN